MGLQKGVPSIRGAGAANEGEAKTRPASAPADDRVRQGEPPWLLEQQAEAKLEIHRRVLKVDAIKIDRDRRPQTPLEITEVKLKVDSVILDMWI